MELHNKTKIIRLGWLILTLILSACGQVKTPNTTRITIPTTVTLTNTAIPILLIPTLTQINKPTQTNTHVLSATPKTTVTMQSTNTREPTPTIAKATLDVLKTVKPFLPICQPGGSWQLSPNGQWITDQCERENRDGPYYLKVLNIYDNRIWRIDFDMSKYGNDGGLSPAHWTSDGKYLYVTVFHVLDGPDLIYWDGSALLRLNLTTGETIEILPDAYYAFSFSPSEKLAYILKPWNSPQNMNILDLHAWKARRILLGEYCGVGQMLWGPTEDRIVFQAAKCKNEFLDISSYSLVLLNLNDGSQKRILSSTEELPRPLEWKNEFPIYLDREYTYPVKDTCYVLNFNAGELQPIACPMTPES